MQEGRKGSKQRTTPPDQAVDRFVGRRERTCLEKEEE